MTNTSDYSNVAKVWDDGRIRNMANTFDGDNMARVWDDKWLEELVGNYSSSEELVALYPKKSVQPFRLTPARGSEQYVKALNNLIARLV